jgi:hypothetical protein
MTAKQAQQEARETERATRVPLLRYKGLLKYSDIYDTRSVAALEDSRELP